MTSRPMRYLIYTVLFIPLLAPFILSGSYNGLALPLMLALALLGLTIANRKGLGISKTGINVIFAAFLLSLIVVLPFSLVPVRSLSVVIWWLAIIGIFLVAQSLADRNVLDKMAKFFVSVTAIFGILSLYIFVATGLTSYTRLDGIVGSHNVYGGFLIIPLLIGIYLVFSERNKWLKVLRIISCAIIASSVVLTFSRGTWTSIMIAAGISIILFWKQVNDSRLLVKKNILSAVLIVVATAVLTGGIWFAARAVTAGMSQSRLASSAVFSNENAQDNAFTARLHYFADAFHVFMTRPLAGYGPGMYAYGLRINKIDPNYGSFDDPHNWLLRILSEDGIFAGILFSVFLGLMFWQMRKSMVVRKETSWLELAIFTGLVGSAIHGLMDFDWSSYLILLVFFTFAGALHGSLREDAAIADRAVRKEPGAAFPKWVTHGTLAVLVFAVIGSLQIFRADSSRALGDYDLSLTRNPGDSITSIVAINEYKDSASINPYDSLNWYDLWRAYYLMKDYPNAKKSIDKAVSLFPENGIYYSALATTDYAQNDFVGYREALLDSIKYFPASDLSDVARLAEFDYSQKKYDEAAYYIDQVLPIYAHYQSVLWYKNDPNWPVMSANLAQLNKLRGQIAQQVSSSAK